MSSIQISEDNDGYSKEDLMKQLKVIKTQVVEIEILSKSKYDSKKPLEIQNTVKRLKHNIFDLDIFLEGRLV